MSKLSLEALKLRAEAVASEELLASINGGTANACHNGYQAPKPIRVIVCDNI
jgi:hypothetical protein